MEETDTPLQRPARFANQEYSTPAQRAELDEVRSALAGKDQRAERGTELDVGGSYNQLFVPRKHSGVRTSMIVDPPNGRIPPVTAEAQKIAAADREFRLALIQATDSCKLQYRNCVGGKYDPTPSPPRAELAPRYSVVGMNRHDGPEDRADAGGHLDDLRRGPGPRMAANHSHGRQAAFAAQHPPMVRGFARPLGGKYARHRRHQLQSEDRLSGLARKLAPRRTLDADEPDGAGVRAHDRGPDRVDEAVDRQARVHASKR